MVYGNRGRPCKHKTKEKSIKRIVALARVKYRGFNDHHLTEKLKEQEQMELSREKVRQILRFPWDFNFPKAPPVKHRSRRQKEKLRR